MEVVQSLQTCQLCPRRCTVNRVRGERGFCGASSQLRIASIGTHFGEEPPISGKHGSGTVFFSGCTLHCDFCQNYQISHDQLGENMEIIEVVDQLETLYHTRHIHNVNFVTPDHFFPHTRKIVEGLRARHVPIPILYNMSGYERVESLKALEDAADIYLPDFKYADAALGERLSHCSRYPSVALDALAEMVRQKGILDICLPDRDADFACQGVLIRHLILPNHVQNSLDALSMLFIEFGKDIPLSLMSQYHPVQPCSVPELQRRISVREFQQVYEHAQQLGFQNLFVQYPIDWIESESEFLPDFAQTHPFQGNKR